MKEFTNEAIWAWCFFSGKASDFKFNFFNRYRDIHIFCLLLSQFLVICVFQGIFPFHLTIKLIGVISFMAFPYNHLNVLLWCFFLFSFMIWVIFIFSFIISICLARNWSVLLIFSKTSFSFHRFFYCLSVFYFNVSCSYFYFPTM